MEQKLKAGSTAVYKIGDQELRLTPMAWGRLKQVLKLFSDSWASFDQRMANDPTAMMKWIIANIEARMSDMFPLLIDQKLNPFFNEDWVEENLTLQHIQQIVTDAITINGVKDFLGLVGKGKNLPQAEQKQQETVAA